MSTVKKKGVNIRCKAVSETFLQIIVEPIKYIEKPKIYLEAYISIRQPHIIVNTNSPVIHPYLPRSLF